MRDWLIKYWLGVVFGAGTGAGSWAVAPLLQRPKKQQTQQEAMKDGMLALMHDRIFSVYADCRAKGYATVEDIRNLEYLYRPYHKLGGNGTGTELYERIKKMPPEPVEK